MGFPIGWLCDEVSVETNKLKIGIELGRRRGITEYAIAIQNIHIVYIGHIQSKVGEIAMTDKIAAPYYKIVCSMIRNYINCDVGVVGIYTPFTLDILQSMRICFILSSSGSNTHDLHRGRAKWRM